MSTPFRLVVPRELLEEMIAQARAELPNECCGLLAGRIPGPGAFARVERRYPLVNAAHSPVRYLSDADSMFAAIRECRRYDLEVLAVYHSHPTSGAVPSRTDLELNYSREVVNFIISLKTEKAEVKGWWLSAEQYVEAKWEVIEANDL